MRRPGHDKGGTPMPAPNAQTLVRVQIVQIRDTVSTQWSFERVFHGTRTRVHHTWQGGTHEPLHGQEFGVFGQGVLGWMRRKQLLPCRDIVGCGIGFETTTSDPHRVAIRCQGIGNNVSVRCHDASDGTSHVAIGSILRKGRTVRLDRKCGDDAVVVKTKPVKHV